MDEKVTFFVCGVLVGGISVWASRDVKEWGRWFVIKSGIWVLGFVLALAISSLAVPYIKIKAAALFNTAVTPVDELTPPPKKR